MNSMNTEDLHTRKLKIKVVESSSGPLSDMACKICHNKMPNMRKLKSVVCPKTFSFFTNNHRGRQNRNRLRIHTVGDTKPVLALIPRSATNRRSERRPEKY